MPIDRRSVLKSMASASLLTLAKPILSAQEIVAKATRGTPSPKIKDISVIECQPGSARLTVVKVTTDQPGLYGYGCATFTQRADLIKPAVERYLKPFLIGKPADRIEDTWQSCYDSSYWKNGPILNNALSGVDQALWDIKGRQCGVPVYQLVGGKAREAVDLYTHAGGAEFADVVADVKRYQAQGFRNLRVQVGLPGMSGYGSSSKDPKALPKLHDQPMFESAYQFRRTIKMLEYCRAELGDEVGLIHDVHERLTPSEAIQLAKAVEPVRLFFLEDALSPEDIDYFKIIRQQCTTPLAMGELFNSPHEWQPLIEGRLIDYIRCHVSQVGGFTPARKLAILAEAYGVKTAWHGPGDMSPIAHMAQITLDIVSPNFGIQEYTPFGAISESIFKGCPVVKDGYFWVNEAPGWGIEVDEAMAAKYPFGKGPVPGLNGSWGELRKRDGSVIKQ